MPLPALPGVLQATYTLLAASILLANTLAPLRRRFIAYGKTATLDAASSPDAAPTNPATRLLDRLATLTVPHRFFTHFYVAGTLAALLWLSQLLTRGTLFQRLAPHAGAPTAMTVDQALLSLLLFLLQTSRRLFECVVIQKSGAASRMHVAHYAVGLLFYTATPLAIWLPACSSIAAFPATPSAALALLTAPSPRSILGVLVFLLASGFQHDCHAHLATLKKYSVPTHEFFGSLVCPHYTAECVIYAAIAIVAAPPGSMLSPSVAAALVFVATILAVSAGQTKEWYRRKFGEEAVRGKRAIFPWVY